MNKYISKYYLSIIFLLLLVYTAKINWSNGQWESVLGADAKGYYAYLPASFIYDDFNFNFYEVVEVKNAYDKNLIYDYRFYYEGHTINKYFVGESVLLVPFFLIAHFTSSLLGFPTDGYSQLYIILLTFAAIFYLSLGLVFLRKSLTLFNLNEINIFIVTVATVFGTNLFYYSIGEVGMTHVYSFSIVSIFIYHILKYFRTLKIQHVIYASFALGLIILIRPVNAIIVLSIPFLSQDSTFLINGIKQYFHKWKVLFLSTVIIFSIVSIQLLIYKIQTGSFFVYSYGDEGFEFTKPHMIDFLFSYKKGFFLYTPICMVALFGFFHMLRHKFMFLSLFSFLFITVYVLSSWHNWYYGGSFSSRVMVEYLPYFAILLGLLLKRISKSWIKMLLLVTLTTLILVNQIQILQYRYYVIHWSEMNKDSYWDIFLDLDPIMERRKELNEISTNKK